MALQELAKDFVSELGSIEKTPEVRKLSQGLQKALASGDNLLMQNALDDYIEGFSDIVLDRCESATSSPAFKALSNRDKSIMVRRYLSMGAKVGYGETATATMKVYQELLKNVGVTSAPVSGILNADRLKGAVAGSIKHAIADDGRLQTSMRDSFRQLIRSGNLDTVEATSKKVELRTGKIMWVRRVVTSSKACDFCHLLAGTWFKASDGKAAPRQFHDSCTCKLEMKIDSPEVEDFEFDLDDDFEDFEF